MCIPMPKTKKRKEKSLRHQEEKALRESAIKEGKDSRETWLLVLLISDVPGIVLRARSQEVKVHDCLRNSR